VPRPNAGVPWYTLVVPWFTLVYSLEYTPLLSAVRLPALPLLSPLPLLCAWLCGCSVGTGTKATLLPGAAMAAAAAARAADADLQKLSQRQSLSGGCSSGSGREGGGSGVAREGGKGARVTGSYWEQKRLEQVRASVGSAAFLGLRRATHAPAPAPGAVPAKKPTLLQIGPGAGAGGAPTRGLPQRTTLGGQVRQLGGAGGGPTAL